MSLRVRVDDYPFNKSEERWRHNPDSFRNFHRALSELIGNRRYLLGVIPKKSSPEDLLIVSNETDCVVGMHGIEHDEQKLDLYQNEFEPFLTRDVICDRLSEARVALQDAVGRAVRIYMPPRNRIDRKTRSILPEAGFDWYTTGPETSEEHRTGPQFGAVYLHSEPPYEYGRTDEMLQRGAVEYLKYHGHYRNVVLTLHWTWETNIGLEHMRALFDKLPKELFKDFDD